MSRMDPSKLAGWFDALAPGLVLYARQWLPAAAAEDVVQDAFVRLMAEPREPTNLKAWLYLPTRRAALDAARSGRRRESASGPPPGAGRCSTRPLATASTRPPPRRRWRNCRPTGGKFWSCGSGPA